MFYRIHIIGYRFLLQRRHPFLGLQAEGSAERYQINYPSSQVGSGFFLPLICLKSPKT